VKGTEDASEQACIFCVLPERNEISLQRGEFLGTLNDGFSNCLSIFFANGSHGQVTAQFAGTNRAPSMSHGCALNIGISMSFFQPEEQERTDLCGNRGDLAVTM
jgi:hypothetical protein